MKLLRILFFSAALACMSSCAKESADVSSAGEENLGDCVSECTHSGIVHHPAVAATADTRGNIEYWSCPNCGRRFCDANGREEYKGRIYVLPTKYVDPSCMSGYNPFSRGAGTKVAMEVAAILTLGELAVSIANLIAAIASYCDDCQDVINDINQVRQKEQKSADDLLYLEILVKDVSNQMESFCRDMDRMQAEVDTMILNVNEANDMLKKTGETLVKSLESASQADERIRLHNLFDTRYKDVTALEVSTSCAWTAISELLGKGRDLLPDAKTALDSADVMITKVRQIESVVSAWGSDWSYPSETAVLLERFNRMDADYGSTYVKLLDEYAADHFVWEHQAAAFKMMMLQYDFTVLSQAYALSIAYYKTCPDLEEVYLSNRVSSMESDFETVTSLAADKTGEYQHTYTEEDRICNATGKSFAIDAKEILPESFFVSLADKYTLSLFRGIQNDFWKLYGLADTKYKTGLKAVDDYDLELFLVGSTHTSLWEICFNTDAGAMGFRNSFSSSSLKLPAATMIPFEYRTENSYSKGCPDVKVWHNCRTDNMQPEEIYLGRYLGDVLGGECVKHPDKYCYFTFEITARKEVAQ